MVNPIIVSQKEARQLALSCQGLTKRYENTLDSIRLLSYVQIDTISVTERAHNHVLFTRNPSFEPKELSELMDEKSIYEG